MSHPTTRRAMRKKTQQRPEFQLRAGAFFLTAVLAFGAPFVGTSAASANDTVSTDTTEVSAPAESLADQDANVTEQATQQADAAAIQAQADADAAAAAKAQAEADAAAADKLAAEQAAAEAEANAEAERAALVDTSAPATPTPTADAIQAPATEVAATAVPVVPPVFSLATCVGYAPVFNVQGGDSSTYQDPRITGTAEGDLEPSVSESVTTDSSATIETPERPGNWTYFLELRNTEGEPVFAGGQTITVKLPCADPDPETYVFKIPPAPGREYVNDDPAKEGDACYSVDKLAVLNTDQLVYGVVDCAPTVTIIQPNTVFTDGTTTVTYPKPVDVYTPPAWHPGTVEFDVTQATCEVPVNTITVTTTKGTFVGGGPLDGFTATGFESVIVLEESALTLGNDIDYSETYFGDYVPWPNVPFDGETRLESDFTDPASLNCEPVTPVDPQPVDPQPTDPVIPAAPIDPIVPPMLHEPASQADNSVVDDVAYQPSRQVLATTGAQDVTGLLYLFAGLLALGVMVRFGNRRQVGTPVSSEADNS